MDMDLNMIESVTIIAVGVGLVYVLYRAIKEGEDE